MGAYKHKTVSKRKLITLEEWARFFGVSRPTVEKYRSDYIANGGEYDPRDIYSVLRFFRSILLKRLFGDKILREEGGGSEKETTKNQQA